MPKASGTFLDELALGRYLPADSPLHAAPVASKAIGLTLVALTCFLLESSLSFLLIGLCIAWLAKLAQIPQKTLWRSLRPLLLLAAFTMLAGAFLNHPAGSLTHPVFSWAGLHQGALYAARLLVLTLLTTVFFLTTIPDEAIAFGVKVMSPMRLLGIETQELSLLVHLAYRFVPTLIREIEAMRLGRRARNLPPPVGLWARGREAVDSLVSLLVGSLHRAETTGLAIEQRGLLQTWKTESSERATSLFGLWPVGILMLVTGVALSFDSKVW